MTTLNVQTQTSSGMPAPSGTWTFSVVRDDIIRDAMFNLGLLEESEVPTSREITDCARRLNMLCKQKAGNLDKSPGFKMYQRKRADLFLGYSKFLYNLGGTGDNWVDSTSSLVYPTAFGTDQLIAQAAAGQAILNLGVGSTSQFTLGDFCGVVCGNDIFWSTISVVNTGGGTITLASNLTTAAASGAFVYNYTTKAQRPMAILTCVLRDSNGTDTPLDKMTLQQYEALPTKTQPGFVQDPTAWYYEPQMLNNLGQLYIDCSGAQDVTKRIHAVYLRESMDFDNPGDAPEYPQEYYLDLVWELALQICGMFDADWTPDRQAAYSVATTRAREGTTPEESADYFQVDEPDG